MRNSMIQYLLMVKLPILSTPSMAEHSISARCGIKIFQTVLSYKKQVEVLTKEDVDKPPGLLEQTVGRQLLVAVEADRVEQVLVEVVASHVQPEQRDQVAALPYH